jgi:CheY-like chemotaxis protein
VSFGRKVLLIAPTASKVLSQAIRNEGYHLTVTPSFQVAKTFLAGAPDVLLTELKLGDYNGLHLALRASALGIPSIVIAEEKFQQEVEQLGAVWISPDAAESDELHIALARLLPEDPATNLTDGNPVPALPDSDRPVTLSEAPRQVH